METINRRDPNFDDIINLADERLRRGIGTLSQWNDQARGLLKQKPGVMLGALTVVGFMTGLLLRQSREQGRSLRDIRFSADPFVAFLCGAVSGALIGPQILREGATESRETGTLRESVPIRNELR
jgi:hypothetical protein